MIAKYCPFPYFALFETCRCFILIFSLICTAKPSQKTLAKFLYMPRRICHYPHKHKSRFSLMRNARKGRKKRPWRDSNARPLAINRHSHHHEVEDLTLLTSMPVGGLHLQPAASVLHPVCNKCSFRGWSIQISRNPNQGICSELQEQFQK